MHNICLLDESALLCLKIFLILKPTLHYIIIRDFNFCVTFLSFTLNIFLYLYLQWIFFHIQSHNFSFLLGMFRPFTFNIIINIVGFNSNILQVVFYFSHLFSVFVFTPFLPFLRLFVYNYDSILSPLLAGKFFSFKKTSSGCFGVYIFNLSQFSFK